MDSASQELFFQRIQELVHDDDKVVTVSSLASDLGTTVQDSRNLILKYVKDQRKLMPDELAVTYIIWGTLKDNEKKGVFMTKEDDLNEKRKLFKNDPCEVIYSIQKNKNVDYNIIALMDMFSSTNIREAALNGSVVSKNCIKRTLKFKKLPTPPPPTLKGKTSFFAPKVEAVTSTSSQKSNASPKNEQKVKNSGGIADLFKTAAGKPKSVNDSTSAKPNKPTKSGGLAGFLSNGGSKSPKAVNKGIKGKGSNMEIEEQPSSNSESQNSISGKGVIDIVDVDFDEEPVEVKLESKSVNKSDITENAKRKTNVPNKQKTSKRQRDKSKELPSSKRRKRIIERNDSDSDDMFEKDDDNIIDKSDEEPERIPSPVVQTPVVPKNKRRKEVTRNYEDEEGFIVTKTEYVYETASEDENIAPEPPKLEKREEKAVPKAKVTDKKKRPAKNQATLMSFFKKK